MNDFSFNGDHLELSKINLQPKSNKYSIQFYENANESEAGREGYKSLDNNGDRKIGVIPCVRNDKIKEPIRLPSGESSIFLEV